MQHASLRPKFHPVRPLRPTICFTMTQSGPPFASQAPAGRVQPPGPRWRPSWTQAGSCLGGQRQGQRAELDQGVSVGGRPSSVGRPSWAWAGSCWHKQVRRQTMRVRQSVGLAVLPEGSGLRACREHYTMRAAKQASVSACLPTRCCKRHLLQRTAWWRRWSRPCLCSCRRCRWCARPGAPARGRSCRRRSLRNMAIGAVGLVAAARRLWQAWLGGSQPGRPAAGRVHTAAAPSNLGGEPGATSWFDWKSNCSTRSDR